MKSTRTHPLSLKGTARLCPGGLCMHEGIIQELKKAHQSVPALIRVNGVHRNNAGSLRIRKENRL